MSDSAPAPATVPATPPVTNQAPAPAVPPLPMGRLVAVGAVIFVANAALLVLQLVAGRLLAPFIGSSLETWTSIIGVFLSGIALGNAFGGRLADRYPTPKTLAVLLGIGALAALWMMIFPTMLSSGGMHKSLPLSPRIPILAAALCLPAGFVLSLLTPLAIKLGLPDVGHTGRVAGLIFALSTLGCLIGNYLTGFYLIPTFFINTLVLVSAGTLLVLAGASLVLVKPVEVQTPPLSQVESGAQNVSHPVADAPGSPNPHAFPDIRQAYLIVFLASFCGMTLELTASRVLAQSLGVSLFTWTGIIGVMLAGTALGNFTGGLLADKAARPETKLSPRFYLAATLILAGAATVFMFVSMALITRFQPFEKWGPITQVMGWTFSMFFLPMFLLGLVSPQVIRLAVPDVAHVGRVAGRVYAWSTCGAIVGTFAAGYVLLSTLGMFHTILAASLVLTLTSLLVVNVWNDTRAAIKSDNKTAHVAGSGALLYLFSIVLGGVTGGFILTSRDRKEEYVAQVESNYYTIKVTRSTRDGLAFFDPTSPESRRLSLNLDRLLHSVVDPYDPTYLYYAHEHTQMEFMWLARKDTFEPRALVIGGGGYTFPRYAQETMPASRVDVVEIDPKVTKVAREYLGLKDYPNLRAIHMDGRQFVAEKATPGSYDLVIQDAVNDLSVPAHLMTKEYNDSIKAALKPNGVYLLTIIDSVEYGKLWKAAMATLKETFPAENVVLLRVPSKTDDENWYKSRHVLVIYASDKPFSLRALQNSLPKPSADEAMAQLSEWLVSPIQTADGSPVLLELQFALNALRFSATVYNISTNPPEPFTVQVSPALLKQFTDIEPGVILTDQYCPVDNLMAEVFRKR